ncbi:MAG: ribosome-associated translation inhibitor RaiA [Clostridium sp.]|uniref:ribosome hibernation-promoting factor, HPF/YfiA family n=1 Tax=Clostridium sp. DSM 8431 TaxID=1761781 RepID=UPI0008ED6C3C|nr:ribosome-associated translation inhibitor RaiA [Clostridium sp. DSM 8431]MCR4945203.1 ribosome-associated translation inhibitor RaiA [Clostridium sp.]SFU82470.1 putative sigma-54 modulation protein [Clostridium sp. DSM 8431]
MKVTVVAKNIQLTPALKESVEKKISKLDRYFEPNIEARATLSVQKNRQIVEVTIPFNGVILRGEESTEDMYKSIDLVEDKLERQIRKQKTKLAKRNSGGSLRYSSFNPKEVDESLEEDKKVVKTKSFNVKPMSSEEAILQMELLGHNFFVYQDADTNRVSVMYKRKDGDYGLIEPDYK